jgi:hypothetical protein
MDGATTHLLLLWMIIQSQRELPPETPRQRFRRCRGSLFTGKARP